MDPRYGKLVTTHADHVVSWRVLALATLAAGRLRDGPALHVARGYALERGGRAAAALPAYERAAALARVAPGRSAARWLHPAQFFLERTHARLAQPRVEDPLFACELVRLASTRRERTAGRFGADFGDSGLRVFGFTRRDVDRVRIELDGRPLRTLTTSGGRLRSFTFTLQRDALARFPREATLAVRDGEGAPLRYGGGGSALGLRVPHGDGSLMALLERGETLDKKGSVALGSAAQGARQRAYLELYDRARQAFDALLGRPLFLMYGTLLGCVRDGALIPGDDDFDVGYLSDAGDAGAVVEETLGVVDRLVRAGFDVSFNRRGRPFRLSGGPGAPADAPRVHLDVRPVWFQDGRVWAHNHFTMPAGVDDWAPVASATLERTAALVPRDTERFLASHYGPGWRVPDPAFTYHTDAIGRSVFATLDRALLTPARYRAARAEHLRLRLAEPTHGTFLAAGWEDLYPLGGHR